MGLFGLLWFVLFFMVLYAELFTMLVMIVFWIIGRLLLFLFAVFGGCLIVVLLWVDVWRFLECLWFI